MVKTDYEGKPLDQIKKIQVIKTEEKGSDVNIATHILIDGFQNKYDAAAVISNDSDLKLPIEMVKNVLKKTVGVSIIASNGWKGNREEIEFSK